MTARETTQRERERFAARPPRVWPAIIRMELTEEDRLAVNAWYGNKGMATIARTRQFAKTHGTAGLELAVQAMHDQRGPREPIPDPVDE